MTTKQTIPIQPQHLCWLAAGIIMAILPHGLRMPVWIILLSSGLILFRIVIGFRNQSFIFRRSLVLQILKLITLFFIFSGVYLHYGTLVGRNAGTALLVLLTGFKVLEVNTERDFYVANFLGYFVIMTNFFYTQSIATAVYMILTLLVMIHGLIKFNDPGQLLPDITHIKTAGFLLFQTLPLTLILFLLFPRINGPLWGMPKDAHAGITGIDDVMEPGSISQLIQTNEVAFRVEFAGEIPIRSKLYWRGPVLWYTDGRKWTRNNYNRAEIAELKHSEESLTYTVTLEPTSKNWLFALEMPAVSQDLGFIGDHYQLLIREPIRQRLRYRVISHPDYKLESNLHELIQALQLPEGQHQETIRLARSWMQESNKPQNIIDRALQWFNEDNFYYTLSPPILGSDVIDDFLFRTKQGFCEHYAAAFVILMRAAGIPSRVVTGYQGGDINPVGNYMMVYQRDAHAWTEVWLEGQGWVRIDPTAAVSPARVEEGIGSALPDAVIDIPNVFGQSQLSRQLWQRLNNTWDALNNQWNQWVISYGPKRQLQFLGQFGLGNADLKTVTTILAACICAALMLITFLIFWQKHRHTDTARTLYDDFCKKLVGIGVSRLQSEGPLDFAERVTGLRNDLATPVNDITGIYIDVRYGSKNNRITELKLKIKKFHPTRIPMRKFA